ncbi:MAG: hypothetical protein IJH55_01850 [Romboutsia sp.]|nr:hypothetical protein [Romboutsia sp.]
MLVTEVVTELEASKKFEVRTVEYKAEEDKAKYGKSFEALAIDREFCFVNVNGLTFKARRIIEEFGSILFINDGNQVEVKPEDIKTLKVE